MNRIHVQTWRRKSLPSLSYFPSEEKKKHEYFMRSWIDDWTDG